MMTDYPHIHFVDRRNSNSDKWRRVSGTDIIPAWVADMDFMAAPPILSALHDCLEQGVFGYSTVQQELPDIIAEYFLQRWQWSINPEWLLYSPGLGAAIHNVCRIAGDDGGQNGILTPAPIYPVFRQAPTLAKQQRLDVQMDESESGWTLSIDALERALTPQTRVLQLCNPHNPNGKVYSRDELIAIGEFCLRHDLIICTDEVHADLILDEDKVHIPMASLSADIAKRTITLQSPSKAFNVAGLNFAVIVIPDDALRQRYQQAFDGNGISHLNPFGYAAAAAAWSGDCDSWLAEVITLLRDNRNQLAMAIADIEGIDMPPLSATYLAWLRVEALQRTAPLAHFRQHGIELSAGSTFGDERYMRLNFGCSPTLLSEMIACLKRAANDTGQ